MPLAPAAADLPDSGMGKAQMKRRILVWQLPRWPWDQRSGSPGMCCSNRGGRAGMLKEEQRQGPWDRNLWCVLSRYQAGLAGGAAVLRLERAAGWPQDSQEGGWDPEIPSVDPARNTRILENWEYSVRYRGCWEDCRKYRPGSSPFQAGYGVSAAAGGQRWWCDHQQGSSLRDGALSP